MSKLLTIFSVYAHKNAAYSQVIFCLYQFFCPLVCLNYCIPTLPACLFSIHLLNYIFLEFACILHYLFIYMNGNKFLTCSHRYQSITKISGTKFVVGYIHFTIFLFLHPHLPKNKLRILLCILLFLLTSTN